MPLKSSRSMKLLKKSLNEKGVATGFILSCYISIQGHKLKGVCIHTPTRTNQTKVTGINIFQPSRII